MTDRKLQEAEALARKIVRMYFCESDMDFMISTFADDIIWVGGGEYQKARGKETVAASFLSGKDEMIPFRMWDENYECARISENSYVCSCDSMMETDPSADVHMKVRQRCTFVFREKGNSFETVHIHNSMPFSHLEDEELFPVKMAKEAYERLQALSIRQDRQLDLILNQLKGGMVICSVEPPYQVEWMSDNFADLLGFANYTDFVKKTANTCRDFILPEDYEMMVSRVSEQLAEDGSYLLEYRIHTRKGKILWVSEMGKRLVETGNREVLYAVFLDITDRKVQDLRLQKVTQEIRQNADFLTQLYQTIPCGIIQFTADREHRILNANRMACEIYGYTEDEYRAEIITPFAMVLDQDMEKMRALVDSMTLESGSITYTREAKRKDGSVCWINVVMERLINAKGRDVIQAIYSDVTVMREMQLRQQQEQVLENRALRAAIWSVYQAIISLNLTENTYSCLMHQNFTMDVGEEGRCDALFASIAAYISEPQREAFQHQFGTGPILNAFAEGRRELYLEVRQEAGTTSHWLSIQVVHVENPYDSDVIGILLMRVLDKERAEKARQEQLLQNALWKAQKASQAKSDFLSRISHDIRTPMNAIIGMASLGRGHTAEPDRMEECLNKIDISSKYLLSLLNDVLDMSRIESGKLILSCKEFDFQDFTESLLSMIQTQADAKRQTLTMNCEEEVFGNYEGDYLRLHQILMNLLSNAVKYTPEEGRIDLDIRDTGLQERKHVLEFRVADTGIGMSREFLQRLYQPFEQESADMARNMTGAGLGLSIVFNLVHLMKGSIEAESEKGKGTVFYVRLPLKKVRQPGRQKAEEEKTEEQPFSQMRVLLVEDNELNREIATGILEMKGIVVESAEDGLKAVEMFEGRPQRWFDVILMDIRMPRMDGLESTRTIRNLNREDARSIPIIAMTANAFDTDREMAAKAGINEYLIKPLDIKQLFRVLERFTREDA